MGRLIQRHGQALRQVWRPRGLIVPAPGSALVMPPAPSPLLTGLIDYFPLNEGAGTTSASANSATVLTLTGATWTTGGVNDDAVVDSTSAIIVSDTVYSLGSGAWALSMWIKTTTTGAVTTNNVFFQIGPTSSTAGKRIALSVVSGVLYGQLTSNTINAVGGTPLNTGSWAHVVISKPADGNVTAFTAWVNGAAQTLTTSGTSTVDLDANPLNLSQQASGTRSLNGSIDEVGLWSRELTADEVATLYNGGAGRPYPFS